MSLLDFDGDEEFDHLLARIQRRHMISNMIALMLMFAGAAITAFYLDWLP